MELVTDYLEGDLAQEDRAAVEAHLAQCGHCAGYVEQVRRPPPHAGAAAGAPRSPSGRRCRTPLLSPSTALDQVPAVPSSRLTAALPAAEHVPDELLDSLSDRYRRRR